MRSFSNATQMSRCALRGNCRTQPVAYFSSLCSLSIFLSLSSIPAYAEWVAVEKEYLLPGLQSVYVDPESIRREGNLVMIWQLIDFTWMQGNPRGLIDFCPEDPQAIRLCGKACSAACLHGVLAGYGNWYAA